MAPGVYADAKRLEAEVSVGSGEDRVRKSTRFPHGTGLREIQAWQEAKRTDLRTVLKLAPRRGEHGTLRRCIRDYVKTLPKTARAWRRSHLLAWVAAFGDHRPDRLTGPQLEEQARRWERDGVAAGTINHRKKCLRALYASLYGAEGHNPASDIRHRRGPRPEARGVPYAWIYEVLDQVRDTDSRARLEVIAFTGIPHARLMRLRAHDVDLKAGTVYLLPRLKGTGTEGRAFPLTLEGIRALRRFLVRGCLGPFSPSSTRKAWHRAWQASNEARVERRLPPLPWIRPYDLRHTYGTWLYEQDGDLNTVAELLDVTLETAKRYTHGAIPARLRQAIQRVAAVQRRPRGVRRRVRQLRS